MFKSTPALLLTLALLGLPLAVSASTPVTPAVAPATALPVPEELTPFGNGWNLRGSGVLRFFGFKAYDAHLWQLPGNAEFSYARPFALDIRYDMNIKGSDIVNTSLIELSRITPTAPEQLGRWSTLLGTIFTDVKPGDRLVGLHLPGRGVRFFLNGRLRGESTDTAFSEAFFKIWLDPATKRPELRARLLGQSAAQAAVAQ
ncbi:MAG: chalcone isomerase family protein [Hylemonella sp.]|nr:chalcone isomerase family protein [Hylemonella sp.]